ncbi:Uncharacterised protein [Acinetobacter baumannii]|nr:Uncharacterised protein [Acinetobacter baumannii]
MDVAVGDFLGVGLAHVDYLDLEVQALAGQRMVAVDGHVVAVDVADGDDLHAAVRSRGVELHADFQFVDAFEHLAGQGRDQFGAVFAIGVFRLDGDAQFVTDVLAFQGLLQADDDVAGTVQVDQRRATSGTVDDIPGVVGQGIVDGNRLVGRDLHGSKPFR